MKKGQRAAIINLFHNQCQFFAHLKAHNIPSVDLNDLMLMPIPSEIKKEDYPKLDRACKALMEYGFVNRIHIMEFLREKNAIGNWWDPPRLDPNLESIEVEKNISGLINTFHDSDLQDKTDDITKNNSSVPNNSVANSSAANNSAVNGSLTNSSVANSSAANTSTINSSTANTSAVNTSAANSSAKEASTANNSISNQNGSSLVNNNPSVTYFHLPYRSSTDIAFVDCGPTPLVGNPNQSKSTQYLPIQPAREVEIVGRNKNSQIMIQSPTSASKSFAATSISTSINSPNKVYTMSTSNTTNNSGPKISVKKFASDPASSWAQLNENSENSSNQSQVPNAKNAKILTVHSEKCLDLSSIISQLPPDVMNSKKIVFIEQNSNQVQYQKNSPGNKSSIQISSTPSLSANCIKVVPQRRLQPAEKDRSKPVPILPAGSLSSVRQISQPMLSHMMSPPFSMNSVMKQSFKMSSVANQPEFNVNTASNKMISVSKSQSKVVKTVPIQQKITGNTFNRMQKIAPNTSDVRIQQMSFDGRVLYQAGKKYVIKQSNKINKPSTSSNSLLKTAAHSPTTTIQISKNLIQVSNSVNYNMTKTLSKSTANIISKPKSIISSSLSPLASLPSPSELSSGSSCDVQAEKDTNSDDEHEMSLGIIAPQYRRTSTANFDLRNLSFSDQKFLIIKHEAGGRHYLHVSKNVTVVTNTKTNIIKCKQSMLDNFPYLSDKQILKRIQHVQQISKEYSRIMKVTNDKIIMEHRRLISCLEDSIEQARLLSVEGSKDKVRRGSRGVEDFDIPNNWEKESMQKCSLCQKDKKPDSYLVGFSTLSADESVYCQCYNFLCNTCNTFQGNLTRFTAHINYHNKSNPYDCPECLRRFPTYELLEKHVWLECFHPLVKNWMLGCQICGIGGLTTIESLIRHFLIMHCEKKFICAECKRVFNSVNDFDLHEKLEHDQEHINKESVNEKKQKDQEENHNDDSADKISSNLMEIISCKIGRCIVFKENFRNHLIDHAGVEEQIFYKCPFCTFSRFQGENLKDLFREHMFFSHSHLLPQYTNFKILSAIQESLKNAETSNEEVLPMIINTRTIAQEAFEKGTQDEESDSETLKIVDVRSEAMEFNLINDSETMPKILEVKSIANDFLHTDCKDSDTVEENSNAVIEITFSSENVSSIEATSGMKNGISSESEAENPESREDNTIERENNDIEEEMSTIDKEESAEKQNSMAVQEKLNENENSTIEENPVVNTEDSTMTNEKSAIEDNLKIKNEILKTSAPKSTIKNKNSTEEENSPVLVSALDNLKAKMSRTFKNLAKKMETTKTTLQHDFSKTLPKLKTISDENGRPDETIVQPPPLSRIPMHVLNSEPMVEDEQNVKIGKKRKRPNKIAFNGPIHAEEAVVNFKCHVCNKMIDSSWSALKSHFNTWHQDLYEISALNLQLLKITPDYIEGGYKNVLTNKFKCEPSPRKRKRRTRFATKIAEKASLDNSAGICIMTESVEDDEGKFKCKKCDLRCSDMGDLRVHIAKSHRIKGKYLICLECGENFVVAPSLQMHLKAFHAIEDPLTYLLQNTTFAPENLDDTEEEEEEVTTEANQCYVCMAVFENKASVDKHLRVHGMAFLNRKRIEAKKNLNSPEKRLKLTGHNGAETQNGNANLNLEKVPNKNGVEMTLTNVLDSQKTEVSNQVL